MRYLSLLLLTAASFAGPIHAAPCNPFIARVAKTVTWLTGFADSVPEQLLPTMRDEYPDTIYRTLKGKEEFSTLVKIIDKLENIRDVLDSDKQLTFFAPTNEAISQNHWYGWQDEGEHGKKELIENSLKYHMIPGVLEYRLFGQNSTIATHLQARDGSFDDARRRIKVESSSLPPWKTTLNNYVHITESDIHAKNGVIHAIDSPLFVPPDIMDIIYMLPSKLAISSTAFLKTNLQSNYEFNSGFQKKKGGDHQKHLEHHNDRYGRGSPVTTVFVPTNDAWNQLPNDLTFYLFSPAGERTLRKLMAWHTLPDTVVFSEWGRHVDRHHHDKDLNTFDEPDLSFEWDRHFPSFIDQRMPVHVKKSKSLLPGSRMYDVRVQAHGVYASVIDNPAQNGAFHVVPQVLSPRSADGVDEAQNAKDWEEWREWLADWSSKHNESDSK